MTDSLRLQGYGHHSLSISVRRENPLVIVNLPGGHLSFAVKPADLAEFVRQLADALTVQKGAE